MPGPRGELIVQSFGAGVQSVALAVLNATGRVQPRADLAVFADPGSEEQETYRLLPVYEAWLAEQRYPLITVRSQRGRLRDYVWHRSTVIPAYAASSGAPGRRQCTVDWKIMPIRRYARLLGAKVLTVQLGISFDEWHRMRDSGARWVTNCYPLVDMQLSREDCRRIIREVGLPEPPKSHCVFCPYQSLASWQRRAIECPDEFEQCAQLEDRINERQRERGRTALYLSRTLRPLRQVCSGDQLTLDQVLLDECEGGYCFV